MTAMCPYARGSATRVLQKRELHMPCSPASVSLLYPCDLTDAEWVHLAPLLPASARRGRPRSWALRLLVNAIFYVLRTGCAWRYLPREYPPGKPVIRKIYGYAAHPCSRYVRSSRHDAVGG
jgi:transposase